MRQRIFLLLAVLCSFACVAFSQVKVLNSEKFVDTNAIFYNSYEVQCAEWAINNTQLEYVLKNSERVRDRGFHHYVSALPASYSGDILFNGKRARFEINAGAFSKIIFKDSSFAFEYKRTDYPKFFIERIDQYSKSNFKVFMQYSIDQSGIEVPMMWDNQIIPTTIDNHSPSWLNKKAIELIKPKKSDATYRTTTVDGAAIKGDVYLIDTIEMGQFNSTSVHAYYIDNKADRAEGVIGDDVLANTVLGVLFQRHSVTLSSEVPDLGETTELKSNFTSKGIGIELKFRNGLVRTFYLDLGFNGSILLPEKEFDIITKNNADIRTRKAHLSTAKERQTVDVKHSAESVFINGTSYRTYLSTNTNVQERLIGLAFFRSYQFLIIDYKHKSLLLSKK